MGRQHGALVTTHWGRGGGYPVGRGKTCKTTVCLPSLSTKRKCTKTKTACKLAETWKLSLPECTSNVGDRTPMLTGIAPMRALLAMSVTRFNPGALTAPGGLLQHYRTGQCTCADAHRANCKQKLLAVRGLGKTSQGGPIP